MTTRTRAAKWFCLALLLTGCETTPTRVFTYGSQGTEIQAIRLVAGVYGHPADPLPYGGPDIDHALMRMKARWDELKPLLDKGTLGLTVDGEVAVRDLAGFDKPAARKLRSLVKAENRDRYQLYRAMTAAVGYGRELESHFLPYTEETFGEQWSDQAPAGWWLQDADGFWRQKPLRDLPVKP